MSPEVREVIDMGLAPMLERASTLVRDTRLSTGTNDVAILVVTTPCEGGKVSARYYGMARENLRRMMAEGFPSAVQTIARLGESAPALDSFVAVVMMEERTLWIEYALEGAATGGLN